MLKHIVTDYKNTVVLNSKIEEIVVLEESGLIAYTDFFNICNCYLL